jgi:cell division septal protein FtsQ
MKRRRKKGQFNFLKFLLMILILYIISFSVYKLLMMPIKHIRILNTSYLNDQVVLREAKIDNYPSFVLTTSSSIKKKLMKDPYIKDVKVEKKWFCHIYLYIEENKILFFNNASGQVVLENNIAIKNNIENIPHLINDVPNSIYIELIKQMAKVDNNILLKISEIEYRPNEVDKERFLLTMNDGNYIYLTLYTFSKVNNYDEILPTLEKKKGILYLDSGNYFEIIN